MRRGLAAAAVGLALLAPAVLAQTMRGDDWAGQVLFVAGDRAYAYNFEGVGCGLPMWCWSITESFEVYQPGASTAVPGTAAWWSGPMATAGAYHELQGELTFGDASFHVAWWAVAHSICFGAYEGPVLLGGVPAGRGGALKTGPGPDGNYECMPS